MAVPYSPCKRSRAASVMVTRVSHSLVTADKSMVTRQVPGKGSWWVGVSKVPGLAQASLERRSGGAEGEDL